MTIILHKILSWEQLKYMVLIGILMIAHFILIGFFFGFQNMIEDRLLSFYLPNLLNLAIVFPLFLVLIITVQDRYHTLFSGRNLLIFFVYSIPFMLVGYVFFVIIAIVQRIGLMADVSSLFLTMPFGISYAVKWHDALFDKKVEQWKLHPDLG